MSSEDSDDEPLAILASYKKDRPADFPEPEAENEVKVPKKRVKKKNVDSPPPKKMNSRLRDLISQSVIQRPQDVWLYVKDFNHNGPYSCLLCPEWFINRGKIIVHYILNHQKDFCGICRYFVPDREAWYNHQKFHTPWKCSQCVEEFDTEAELREHFSEKHQLVHCRLCHFRIPDNEEYNYHLFEKHSVTNVAAKTLDLLWQPESEGQKYLCLLCSKSNNNSTNFCNHYMSYHHITLKCFSKMISAQDIEFRLYGANISVDFLESQLKDQDKFGYVDFDIKPPAEHDVAVQHPESDALLDALVPEIKQEHVSDSEDAIDVVKQKSKEDSDENAIWNTYLGTEDFDITSTEIIMLQTCYFNYINEIQSSLDSRTVPENSSINYEITKSEKADITCPICACEYNVIAEFTTHLSRMHGVKIVPTYFCRVCATTFDSMIELTNHMSKELGEFEDLWICQFCDKEFDNREATRRHLTQHWQEIDLDNCFSPHLGFKCRYCPTLFWNETDREGHQKRVHSSKHREDFYECEDCCQLFSDKVWFTHHYIEKHLKENADLTHLFKCSLCSLVLSTSVEGMRKHFAAEHADARKIFCSLGSCTLKPFAAKKSFKIHLKSVHRPKPSDQATSKVHCQLCGREFESARACSCHMAQVHGPGRFKCKLCHVFLNTADERKLHYLLQHPGRHPFECVTCGKSFPYKSSLYSHRLEHKPDRRAFVCSYCNKSFMKKDSYREHVLIHEGPRHACSYCPMRFVQRSNMLRHERRHTGERPYSCHYCPASFSDKGACSSHMRTHVKDASYPCMYCGQTFAQKSKLKYHTRKHTGENLETCPVCAKLFTSGCSLREHMKIHSKNKNAKIGCPLCKKYFPDERFMIRHLRSTHNQAGFNCPICNKKLSSSFGLRQHVITHSKVKTFKCKKCPKSFGVKRSLLKHLKRRHDVDLHGNEDNITDYMQLLDVRQCQLGLDEEMLCMIFGPPKNEDEAGTVQDSKHSESDEDKRTDDESSDSEDNDGEERGPVKVKVEVKAEPQSESEFEPEPETQLEPTDFVSVKIEPVDEEEARESQK